MVMEHAKETLQTLAFFWSMIYFLPIYDPFYIQRPTEALGRLHS